MRFIEKQSKDIFDFVPVMAQLRLKVFHEWPYIYDGDLGYEEKYLQRYWQAQHSYVGLLFDETVLDPSVVAATSDMASFTTSSSSLWHPKYGTLVGLTTAIDMSEEDEAFYQPMVASGYPAAHTIYFGESILLSAYRGQGWGKRFMQSRLSFAESLPEKRWACFCSVVRDKQHPLYPEDYRPLDEFWKSQGFLPQEIFAQLSWQDNDQPQETIKDLRFWLRDLK